MEAILKLRLLLPGLSVLVDRHLSLAGIVREDYVLSQGLNVRTVGLLVLVLGLGLELLLLWLLIKAYVSHKLRVDSSLLSQLAFNISHGILSLETGSEVKSNSVLWHILRCWSKCERATLSLWDLRESLVGHIIAK